jgi:hypothetical protein
MTASIDVLPITEAMPCSKAGCKTPAVVQLFMKGDDGCTAATTACEEHTEMARDGLANNVQIGPPMDRAIALALGMTACVFEDGGQLGVLNQTRIAELVQENPVMASMVIAQFARLFAQASVANRDGDAQAAYDALCEAEAQYHHKADNPEVPSA